MLLFIRGFNLCESLRKAYYEFYMLKLTSVPVCPTRRNRHISDAPQKAPATPKAGAFAASAKGMQDQRQGIFPICSDFICILFVMNNNTCFSMEVRRH